MFHTIKVNGDQSLSRSKNDSKRHKITSCDPWIFLGEFSKVPYCYDGNYKFIFIIIIINVNYVIKCVDFSFL